MLQTRAYLLYVGETVNAASAQVYCCAIWVEIQMTNGAETQHKNIDVVLKSEYTSTHTTTIYMCEQPEVKTERTKGGRCINTPSTRCRV